LLFALRAALPSSSVDWIDLKLIANERFVPLIFQYLASENLRVMAARCLYGMAEKGMPAEEKLQLLANLNLRNLVANVTTDDVEFMEELAYLVESIGSSAVVCVCHREPAVREQGVRILNEMLELLFMYMANEYDDVSQKTFNFAEAYIDLV
jgi:Exportin 1-like protein